MRILFIFWFVTYVISCSLLIDSRLNLILLGGTNILMMLYIATIDNSK